VRFFCVFVAFCFEKQKSDFRIVRLVYRNPLARERQAVVGQLRHSTPDNNQFMCIVRSVPWELDSAKSPREDALKSSKGDTDISFFVFFFLTPFCWHGRRKGQFDHQD
jgi:hypothetical protein